MSQLAYLRAFVAQSQKNGLRQETLTFKQMFQLVQLRILYKLAKVPSAPRKTIKRYSRFSFKALIILVFILHATSITNLPLTQLNRMGNEVREVEQAENYDKLGSIFLIEGNQVKESWNGLVFQAYLTVTMQQSVLTPDPSPSQVIEASEELDVQEAEKSGRFTIDATPPQLDEVLSFKPTGLPVSSFTPGRDLFMNYMAFQAGMIEFDELVSLTELQSQVKTSEEGTKAGHEAAQRILDAPLLLNSLVKPEKSLFQFFVRYLCAPRTTLLLVDTDMPLTMVDATIIKVGKQSRYLPRTLSNMANLPLELFEWLFGVKDTIFKNLVASTELTRRKAPSQTSDNYLNLPKKKVRGSWKRDFSNEEQRGFVSFIDLGNQESLDIKSEHLTPKQDPEGSQFVYWLCLKWSLLEKAATTCLLFIGLSATLARYFKKLVHRITAESPKLYNVSFLLQLAGVLYLGYIFVTYWNLGLLKDRWVLKSLLLMTNTGLFVVLKISMIEASQSLVIRDLACLNLLYVSYILTYNFAGYPWWTFWLYLATLFNQIIVQHYVEQLSDQLNRSIGTIFNDPEHLDELVRLNINEQLEGTGLQNI